MVSRNDQDASGLASLPQQRQQQTQVLQGPTLVELIRSTEVIIHGVVDHTYHLLLWVRDRCAHFLSKVPRICQIALVKELGGVLCSAGCHQCRMRRKARPLLRLRTRGQPTAQQAGSTHLRDRWQGGNANKGFLLQRGHKLGPAMACSPCEQLPENAVTQTIHHQKQNRLRCCDWSQYAIQDLLNQYDSLGIRMRLSIPLHQRLGKRLGKTITSHDRSTAASRIRVRQLSQLIAPQ